LFFRVGALGIVLVEARPFQILAGKGHSFKISGRCKSSRVLCRLLPQFVHSHLREQCAH
jgi:hypothetical protein